MLRTAYIAESRVHGGILKGGPQLADRGETADHIHHIHKDATDRYTPCLRGCPLRALF